MAYEGGPAYLEEFLPQHPKEPDQYYQERLDRAVYPNHMRSVIDTYAAHLYREDLPRSAESGESVLESFWADLDLMGHDADEFFERAAQQVQQGGRMAVVVDRYDPDDGLAQTRAQEQAAGRRPYAYTIDTEDIVDWDVDRHGRLHWVMLKEPGDVQRGWNEEHPGELHYYKVWTPEEWILLEEVERETDDGIERRLKVRDRGEHPVGEVPVVFVFWGRREGAQPVADSAIKDLAPLNRRLTIQYSLIDEQIHAHVFNIMAVPESTYDRLGSIDFSAFGAIPYEDDVSQPPHYLGPDVAQIEVIRSEIDQTKGAIRQLSGLGRVNEETKHVQSGIALSYMTMDKDALLGKFAGRMRKLEVKVASLAGAWMEEDTQAQVDYPTKFDPVDLQNELKAALQFSSLQIGGEAAIENAIQAVRARFGSEIDAGRLHEVESDVRERLGTSQITGQTAPSLREAG
ncbi:MAG: hypothetical protein U5L04_02585 [Trueperaceae bacterium]|nr:hypothetical protein [Trueperaceae bacterium]